MKLPSNNLLIDDTFPFKEILLIEEKTKTILPLAEALERAKKIGLDLVCVTSNNNPPVCKLINYQKLIYLTNKKKKKKEIETKEIQLSFNISPHDLEIKLERSWKWIEEKKTVNFILKLMGQEKKQQSLALEKCNKVIDYLQKKSNKVELKGKIKQSFNNFSFSLFKNQKAKQLK